MIRKRKILLLAPGKSLVSEYDKIMEFIEKEIPYVISVNFVDAKYHMDACFVSNHKRMDIIEQEIEPLKHVRTILTSNIPGFNCQDCLFVDYDCYTIDDEMISDNAGLMLLKLLKRCGAVNIFLAGFDGFHHKHNENYYSEELNFKVNDSEIYEKQKRIRKQLKEFSNDMNITFLTRSVYEQVE